MADKASSALVLHCGARQVTLDELNAVKAPPAEGRWFPLSHGHVLGRVKETLAEAGYTIRREQLGLSRNDGRFFGTLDLGTALGPEVTLAVGVRNSTDKSFPLGFCAGSRVFCCDNLAFRSELLIRRKHTKHGGQRFSTDIAQAVMKLGDFKEAEAARIRMMREREVSGEKADSLILNAYHKGIISAPMLPAVITYWREPQFEEFQERTYWSLFNAFTSILADKVKTNPQAFALQTMRLHAHLDPTAGEVSHATAS
jgi:hypothetical protein